MIEAPAKQLLILIDRHETWHERPLSEAIVATLQKQPWRERRSSKG